MPDETRKTLHRCITWALAGAAIGISYVAWAQSPSSSTDTTLDVSAVALVELAKVVGLPGMLAFLGFKFGRLVERLELKVTVAGETTVRLSDDDRRLLTRALRSGPDDLEGA